MGVGDETREILRASLGGRVRFDEPLARHTSLRVGGPAEMFVAVGELSDLVAVAEVRAATGVPVLVIGRGSNTLVADGGFAGVVVSVADFADHIELPEPSVVDAAAGGGGDVEVVAGGGAALPVVARRTGAQAR